MKGPEYDWLTRSKIGHTNFCSGEAIFIFEVGWQGDVDRVVSSKEECIVERDNQYRRIPKQLQETK